MAIRQYLAIVGAAAALLVPAAEGAAQQTVDLGANTNKREVWRGETAGSQAGIWLDRGDVSAGDTRRDLIVGAPGWSSNRGRVYVLFAGPVKTGEQPLSTANAILTGGASGDRFGEATAAGYISAREIDAPERDLVVGAPGANSNAGIVYMYLRGLTQGQSLTPANARVTITGAPAGARLGATLATGDLDGDGYREIIAGAPGEGAVYVVRGGAAVTGTINVGSPSSAFFRIQGSAADGVGRSIAAGDITGDSIYDLAIAAFGEGGRGAVYVLIGRTSNTFPGTMSLTTQTDVRYGGIDVGDAAGRSLDIAPLDNDLIPDLVIGAQDASGPGNARPQAGEIYIIWGAATLTSKSLAQADVTIYGASAGQFEGADLATGDVDRRAPHDLVMLAPGAGPTGELHMILGRPRSAFGSVYDLAQVAMDRRLVGDSAAGLIGATLVYDLTGEGVEDIVAGVPNTAQGLVYVSFSPVLEATLSYPSNGQNTANNTRPFEWHPADNAEMYRLTLGTASGRSDLFDSGEIGGTSITVPQLPTGRTLYARLFTRLASVWRFKDSTFRLANPSSFTFPIQGLSGVRSGNFSWTAVSGAEGYRLVVGSTPGGNEYADSGLIGGTSFNVFSIPPGRTLYGRILTKISDGYSWNDISFSTAATAGTSADSPGRGMGVNFGGTSGGDVLLYAPGAGTWSMQVSTAQGFTGVNSGLWATGWVIKPAEFNGDGLADLFFYKSSTGQWYRGINRGGGTFDFIGGMWTTGWDVTVADFNGDGTSDVFLYNKTTGAWYRAITTGADFDYSLSGTWAGGWSVYPADFNGDGRADLFLYNGNSAADPNNGLWYRVFNLANGTFAYDAGTSRWANDLSVTTGDFNGDGLTDLFLYRPNGEYFRAVFTGAGPVYLNGSWVSGWTVRQGDFNGDGLADLMLYRPSTGLWYMVVTERNGSLSYHGGSYWTTGWDVTISDMNADGRSDVLLYNPSTGTAYQCLTMGLGVFDYKASSFGTNWTVIATRTILP